MKLRIRILLSQGDVGAFVAVAAYSLLSVVKSLSIAVRSWPVDSPAVITIKVHFELVSPANFGFRPPISGSLLAR
jgi:hypothetical protein